MVVGQKGSAVAVVLVISLLVGAAAIGAWTLSRFQLVAAQRRATHARAQRLALSGVPAVAAWLDAEERGALVAPPEGLPTGGPDDPFVGTALRPDLRLGGATGDGQDSLDRLSRILDPGGECSIREVSFYRPPSRAGDRALAAVEVVAEAPVPGGRVRQVRARGEVIAVDWGRMDRPLVVQGDAEFVGQAGWRWGEALITGALVASASTVDGWAAGVPWAGVDRPLQLDNDGDGTVDDRDGDGVADFQAWREDPMAVPDPWWRARVGGGWTGPGVSGFESPSLCQQPFLFGPWRDPPEPARKSGERSGLFLGCASAAATSPLLPDSWLALAQRGLRGAAHLVEESTDPGQFRVDGLGRPRSATELIPQRGGLVVLELDPDRTGALELDLRGGQGAVLVVGGDVVIQGQDAVETLRRQPPWLCHTQGDERPGREGDPALELGRELGGCDAWEVGPWQLNSERDLAAGSECSAQRRHFRGLLGAQRHLSAQGPLRIGGRLRAGSLQMNGESDAIEIWSDRSPGPRRGPPGVPRIYVQSLRVVF